MGNSQMLLLANSYDPYLSVLWTLTFELGQILFHFAFFVILGDILTSPQLAKITFLTFFFQNFILGSLKSKYMVKPQIIIFSPKTDSESLLKVVDALKHK